MRLSVHAPAAALAVAFLAAPLMSAQANLLANGGFEAGQLSAGAYNYVGATRDSWTYAQASVGGGLLINVGGGGGPWVNGGQTGYGGTQVGGIQGLGSIAQTFNAVYNGTYTVSWLDAGRGSTAGGAQTYIASLYDNTIASSVGSLSLNTSFGSIFNAESFSASLKAGDNYTLAFTGQDNVDQTALIDNVNVSQVPEPATLLLFGTGLAGLGWMRRRKAI
jgi:hypothetical protein